MRVMEWKGRIRALVSASSYGKGRETGGMARSAGGDAGLTLIYIYKWQSRKDDYAEWADEGDRRRYAIGTRGLNSPPRCSSRVHGGPGRGTRGRCA